MDKEKIKEYLKNYYKDQEYTLFFLANLIKKRLRSDWDIYISLEGQTGIGKSTFLILLGILVDENFSLQKNLSYIPDGKEIKKEFNALPKYSLYGIDEAAKSLHKYNWYDKLQKIVIDMANTERYQNKSVVLCMPYFSDLTSTFRKGRIDMRIWIYQRGKAIVYLKHNDKDVEDPWYTQQNIKVKSKYWSRVQSRGRYITAIPPEEILRLEKRTINYAFDLEFPDLKAIDPEGFKEYEALKAGSRNIDTKAEEINDNYFIKKYRGWLKALIPILQKHYSRAEISKLSGITASSLDTYMADNVSCNPVVTDNNINLKGEDKKILIEDS